MIIDNPLSNPLKRPSVVVAQGRGAYANTCHALQSIDLSPVQGKRVLLKPNAGRVALPGEGITTHPEVVGAVIDIFRQAGAEVAVGESPITGVDVFKAFESTGVAAAARVRDCPLINMDQHPFVEVLVPQGHVITALQVCREILEFDMIVSIPVMKMHMHTGVTLSVKNMKGCLWRRSKVKLHMLPPVPDSDDKPINIAIADLSSVLRPHLAVIDGTVGMEGLGPSAGRAKTLDVVVVGADAFAADAVSCRLMGTCAEDIPHLRIGAERNYGVIDLERITVTPDYWQDWINPFAKPPENLEIAFPNITVWDNNSCSACQSTLLLFLQRYQDRLFDYFPPEHKVHIAIGKGHTDLPEGTLCIGNCTLKHRGKGLFVPGCPPVASEILQALTGKPSIDIKDGHSQT
jgi:uncharacterized protein (DUF362 family)